ncbi:Sarcolemmal membrane-associated protein [Geodia barretti]|uniref:Sarcolemmal membrane-associated protein n=1 Tax=Geodia barretti TaxID=519541 RepID=A0AA35TPQ3_GEOBA|nr:Sarcolemmal membrane-associated protein [Geodia barretti]
MSEKSNMSEDVPKIVLIPHERSHPFARRECIAREPLKVGRSVDKKRISTNNLIFDCRVLSRNHAVIRFEDGKFYIKDTKSSNGTFVNENRLSPSGEESGLVELKSRDILQFGVNVNVERRVTHGCIIATIKLYVNDVELPGMDPPIHEVLQIVQLALTREQELENKLASMQEVLNSARQLATESMISVVKEDELMSRLEMLENQLQVYSRNSTDDELKKQLTMSFEEKHKTEAALKESLRKILQEKLECMSKLSQTERDYDKAEQECQRYKTLYDVTKEELKEERQNLTTKNEALQAELDFTQNQLSGKKAQVEELREELLQVQLQLQTELHRRTGGGVEYNISQGESSSLTVEASEQYQVPPPETLPLREEAIGNVKMSQTSDATGQRAPSFISESDSDMDEDEAEKLAERVLHLEADLRRSEMTIQGLQQELAATKLAQTPTTDTQRYQLGGGARGQRSTPPPEVHRRSMEELAAIVTGTSVAKGQVEIVRGSLADSQHELFTLQDKLALETEKTQALQETITVLNGQLNLCYAELHSKQQEVIALRSDRVGRGGGGVAVVQELKMRVKSERDEGERLRTQNETLQEEVERLKTELRSEGRGTPTTPHFLRPGSPSGEDQKVRMLTVIALVSIGVALASWLA